MCVPGPTSGYSGGKGCVAIADSGAAVDANAHAAENNTATIFRRFADSTCVLAACIGKSGWLELRLTTIQQGVLRRFTPGTSDCAPATMPRATATAGSGRS